MRRDAALTVPGHLAAKHHAGACCFCDHSVLLIGYGTFRVPDCAAPLHDRSFRSELGLPDRPKEIDFQLDCREGFLWRECTCKRHTHGGVSNIAENSAV